MFKQKMDIILPREIKEGYKFRLFNSDNLNTLDNPLKTLFNSGPTWENYKTRTANRKYLTFPVFLNGGTCYVPSEYKFLELIVDSIVQTCIYHVDDKIVPIQMFVNYYKNGEHSTPGHAHGCRQITVAFGCPRTLKVNSRNIVLESGEGIFLNQQKHSVPKLNENDPFFDQPRISFNFFFTTEKEQRFDVYKR